MQFYNSPEDIGWLLQTHLKDYGNQRVFHSFMLYGNEDCPTKIELFARQNPFYKSKPFMTLELFNNDETGKLEYRETK